MGREGATIPRTINLIHPINQLTVRRSIARAQTKCSIQRHRNPLSNPPSHILPKTTALTNASRTEHNIHQPTTTTHNPQFVIRDSIHQRLNGFHPAPRHGARSPPPDAALDAHEESILRHHAAPITRTLERNAAGRAWARAGARAASSCKPSLSARKEKTINHIFTSWCSLKGENKRIRSGLRMTMR